MRELAEEDRKKRFVCRLGIASQSRDYKQKANQERYTLIVSSNTEFGSRGIWIGYVGRRKELRWVVSGGCQMQPQSPHMSSPWMSPHQGQPNTIQIAVTIPHGVTPGQTIQFTAPNGQIMGLVVPPGALPGGQIIAVVPA